MTEFFRAKAAADNAIWLLNVEHVVWMKPLSDGALVEIRLSGEKDPIRFLGDSVEGVDSMDDALESARKST